jgi:hypothetical protein
MTKRMTHQLTYDAPLAAVSAMLGDQAFLEEVCAYQRVTSATVAVVEADGVRTVTIDQVQAARGIPSFAKKFVGETINVVQTVTWTSPEHADLAIVIPGKPGDIAGTLSLTESGGVTTETVDLTVKIGIPLVGGKIEGLIADLLRKAFEAENTVGRRHLLR